MCSDKLKPRFLVHNWKDTGSDELNVYLAIAMLMAILQVPTEKAYFDNDSPWESTVLPKYNIAY
jgi:hypothetical protein